MALRTFLPIFLFVFFSAFFGNQARSQTANSLPQSPPTVAGEPIKNDGNSEATKPAATPPAWPNFQKAFEAGVGAYQAKKFDEARLAFSAAVEQDPNSLEALTNLALVQFQLGQKGLAVGLLRKSLSLDPDFSISKSALKFILPQMDVKEIPHEIQLWESFRSHFLVPFPLNSFLAMTALSLLAAGWLFLNYAGKRKTALLGNKSLPAFPLLPLFFSLIFVSSLSLSIGKLIDAEMPRGTVIKEKVTVYSAPNERSVALFELYSGLEVVLGAIDDQWVQATYPGALTGWILKNNVLQTSGRNLW